MTSDELRAEILRLRNRYGLTPDEIQHELQHHGPIKDLIAQALREADTTSDPSRPARGQGATTAPAKGRAGHVAMRPAADAASRPRGKQRPASTAADRIARVDKRAGCTPAPAFQGRIAPPPAPVESVADFIARGGHIERLGPPAQGNR